ncbi:MAG: glycosyltransferase family 2 protein [bacterium]
MSVSVVIPHLRGHEALLSVLADLERERGLTQGVEVLVVDNSSSDGSVGAVQQAYPWVRVLHLSENLGYAGGCNAGIRATHAEWVWLLNDDVRIRPGILDELLAVGRSAPDIAAVQPKILSQQDEGKFDYAGGAGGLIDRYGFPFALGRIGGVLEEDKGQYDTSREIFWASGTACLWRREALEDVGLLDEGFFAHMEEIDLAWRAWNAGWRAMSAPKGVVEHFGGGTLSYLSWRKMFLNHRNNLITIAKNAEAKRLWWLMLTRIFLDHGIGVAETLMGRPKRMFAVWLGWLAFLVRTPDWLIARRQAQSIRHKSDAEIARVVYPRSILIAYLRGTRSAAELPGV